MYNVNQLTKIMSMIKLSILNYKNDKILESLDDSFLNLPALRKYPIAFNVPPDNFLSFACNMALRNVHGPRYSGNHYVTGTE